MDNSESKEFIQLSEPISKGKGTGAFAPMPKHEGPKNVSEFIKFCRELPGDDPLSWDVTTNKLKKLSIRK